MSPAVLVVGDVITDIVVRLREPVVWGTDTRSRIASRAGGSAANVAAWLAVAGAQVDFAGRVGDDVFAGFHRGEFARLGVEAHLATDPSAPTGSIVVLVDEVGERTMLTDRGANLHLQLGDLPEDALERSDALYITGYTFFEPGIRQVALSALGLARRAGVPVAVDPSSHPLLAEVGAAFLDWTEGTHYLFPNLAEAAVLTGESQPEAMARRLACRYQEVILTCGSQGAIWCRDGEDLVSVPAPPAKVIDTTGAGDAFAAGFLTARLAGATPREALDAGTELSSRVVATVGARPETATGTPRRREP